MGHQVNKLVFFSSKRRQALAFSSVLWHVVLFSMALTLVGIPLCYGVLRMQNRKSV